MKLGPSGFQNQMLWVFVFLLWVPCVWDAWCGSLFLSSLHALSTPLSHFCWVQTTSLLFPPLFFFFFYFREREWDRESRGEGQRKKGRLLSRLHAQREARGRTWISQLWDHDLSQNQESYTQLTEPHRHPALPTLFDVASLLWKVCGKSALWVIFWVIYTDIGVI